MPIKKRTSFLSKELIDAGWILNLTDLIFTDLDNEIGEMISSYVVDSDVVKVVKNVVEKKEEIIEEEEEEI